MKANGESASAASIVALPGAVIQAESVGGRTEWGICRVVRVAVGPALAPERSWSGRRMILG